MLVTTSRILSENRNELITSDASVADNADEVTDGEGDDDEREAEDGAGDGGGDGGKATAGAEEEEEDESLCSNFWRLHLSPSP